jgi:hypothetical protein
MGMDVDDGHACSRGSGAKTNHGSTVMNKVFEQFDRE